MADTHSTHTIIDTLALELLRAERMALRAALESCVEALESAAQADMEETGEHDALPIPQLDNARLILAATLP